MFTDVSTVMPTVMTAADRGHVHGSDRGSPGRLPPQSQHTHDGPHQRHFVGDNAIYDIDVVIACLRHRPTHLARTGRLSK